MEVVSALRSVSGNGGADHDPQLSPNLHASIVPYCSGTPEVQHSRLPTTAGAVRILEPILTVDAHVILPAGSKKLSRKCVLCRGCDEIAGSLSVRPRTARNKIRRDSFGPTTHPRVGLGPLGIDYDSLLLDTLRIRISLFFV